MDSPKMRAFNMPSLSSFVLLGSPLLATCSPLKRKQNERKSVGEEDRRGGRVTGRNAGRETVGLTYCMKEESSFNEK